MQAGEAINTTEKRQVLHSALRCARDSTRFAPEIRSEVWKVIDETFSFANRVRSGEHLGATGKPLKNVVSIGIGGKSIVIGLSVCNVSL
jgi:glucose-6-phosphate isomerase